MLSLLVMALSLSPRTNAAEEGQELPAHVDARTHSELLFDRTQELIMHALAYLPVRYKWGGKTPDTGLDCSGYVSYVFKDAAGIILPQNAYSMSLHGRSIKKSQLRPGDLVFFNTLKRAFSHVGIYLGDNRFIHAPRAGKTVQIGELDSTYWEKRFNGARRILEAAGERSLAANH
jgi:cell wall-associated NlpC family hydrolase